MNQPLLAGCYLLLDTLGSGGEAKIYRALDQRTGMNVAIRIALHPASYIVPSPLPEFAPAWAKLLASGTDPALGPYQVFELLTGKTLGQQAKADPFDSATWRAFVDQSLDAVAALHQAGWVHGDLNAENFIQSSPSSSLWKLLELPFLRFEPPQSRSSLFGSIFCLAPEQFNGTTPDFRSDLYALGCLYYYAACGEFPHAGGSSQQIAIARTCFPADPLDDKAPQLPSAWKAWVMTLLERDPQNRFPSASSAHQLLGIA